MIIYDNIEFWNVAELKKSPYQSGLFLMRYPESLIENIDSEPANIMLKKASGIELRFKTENARSRLYLKSTEGDQIIQIYKGDFLVREEILKAGITSCVSLYHEANFRDRIEALPKETKGSFVFSPDVWRVVLGHSDIFYEGLDTGKFKAVSPGENDKPKVKWLAYGSSITQANYDGYVHYAAHLLGWDVMNKGMAGSCYCEPAIVDYLCSIDFNIMTMELGINMRDSISVEDFEKRVKNLIHTIQQKHSEKPLLVIDLYENFATGTDSEIDHKDRAYREVLDRTVSDLNAKNVHRIEAKEIMDDFRCLSADLVHPTRFGHARMGANLAQILKNYI